MQNDKRWQHADSRKMTESMAAPQQDELPDSEEISEEILSQVSGGGFGPLGGASGLDGVTLAGTLAAKTVANTPVVGKVVSVVSGPVIGTGLKVMGKVIPDSVVRSQVSRVVRGV